MYGLDASNLTSYLEAHVADFHGPIRIEKFSQGQSNPTYRIETPSGSFVLRRKPTGVLLKSAHAIDREFRVISALGATDIPVPEAHHLCTDESVIGSWFYIMEYVEGTVFPDPALPGLTPTPRARIYDEANRVLAAIHAVDIEAAGLSDFGKAGNYYARQVSRWTKQYRASETQRIEDMETLIEWLPEHIPPEDGRVSLIHGDYRLDNLIFSTDELNVAAVLDWELSTLGHPIADLAYLCMQRRMKTDQAIPGLHGLDLELLGIPNEPDFLASYCHRIELDNVEPWSFYLACSFFRLAAICQGVLKRALDGNASSDRAAELGTMVSPLAALGADAIRI